MRRAVVTVQVSALAAVMEAVRGEQLGVFNHRLYLQAVKSILTTMAAKPEVLSFLMTRYFSFADVRYHTLRCVSSIASQHVVRGGPAAAAVNDDIDSDGDEAPSTSDRPLAPSDLARTLFDALAALPASVSSDPSELTSWCGSAEVREEKHFSIALLGSASQFWRIVGRGQGVLPEIALLGNASQFWRIDGRGHGILILPVYF